MTQKQRRTKLKAGLILALAAVFLITLFAISLSLAPDQPTAFADEITFGERDSYELVGSGSANGFASLSASAQEAYKPTTNVVTSGQQLLYVFFSPNATGSYTLGANIRIDDYTWALNKPTLNGNLDGNGYEIWNNSSYSEDKSNYSGKSSCVGGLAAEIAEGNYERALVFCGTGMGIHIAASKCPHVHAGVVESLPAAIRAITGNGVNVLAMGAFYVAPQTACDIADAYLANSLGSGWEWWHNFYEFHKLAIDELEAFNYDEYKKNGFKVNKLGDYDLTLDFDKKPE